MNGCHVVKGGKLLRMAAIAKLLLLIIFKENIPIVLGR
jgi:hypothetical protein